MHCTLSPVPAAPVNREATVFDLPALLRRLQSLTDQRCPKGLRYALGPVLLLLVLAKLAGHDRPSAIADWIQARGHLLCQALALPWQRMPHHNTWRRILAG